MKASLIIPVWNGASVVGDCLRAVFTQKDANLYEVICVDNASIDESADIIKSTFPQVSLLSQPVNLGFAGGVNAGISEAQGDVFVLLNQDCIPEPGWLAFLDQAQAQHTQVGIFGCTILNADGTLNHTGAVLHRPDAGGQHLQSLGDGQVRPVDFVTGAAVAVRRSTWDAIGPFDDGFYPAYYEDCDYCYRARRQGIETACVPESRVRHSFSSREWQVDPIKHTTNGYHSRYRFVSKHFNSQEITDFMQYELESIKTATYLDHAAGRVIAAKQTLSHLDEILQRRLLDLREQPSLVLRRQLQVGFAEIARSAFQRARDLVSSSQGLQSEAQIDLVPESQLNYQKRSSIFTQQLQELKQTESDILAQSVFRPAIDKTTGSFYSRSLFSLKRFMARLTSGGEFNRIYDLNRVHADQVVLIEEQIHLIETQLANIANLEKEIDQVNVHNRQLEETQKLLEILTEYEYR